jgi:chemotaxis family two-component system response regulator Rcp1
VRIDIPLVEDNDGGIRLMREILCEINSAARLHVVTNGLEGMLYLGYQGRYRDAPRPSVILLDVNLPRMHSHEVLTGVKANPHLRAIPVIVLTSSEADSDVASSYQLMANRYLRKPGNWNQFEEMVKGLNRFWFTRAKLPKQKQSVGPR